MYRKKGRGWTKHIDFMLLDVLCMQILYIIIMHLEDIILHETQYILQKNIKI